MRGHGLSYGLVAAMLVGMPLIAWRVGLIGTVALSYGAASFAVLGLSFLAWRSDLHRYADAMACAAMLLMTWSISNVLNNLYRPPEGWVFYPIMDVICGAVAIWMWASGPAGIKENGWKLGLAGLFLLDCVTHVAFWLHREKPATLLYTYALSLNLIFALQLAVTAWPGGSFVAGRIAHLYRGPGRFSSDHVARDGRP